MNGWKLEVATVGLLFPRPIIDRTRRVGVLSLGIWRPHSLDS